MTRNDESESKLLELTRNFVQAFEEVFEHDWSYSKGMMGILDETEEEKKANEEFGLVPIDVISDSGTFVNPKVDCEIENWGNRAILLECYRELKKKLSE